ncbi:MAG: hypothetical protein ACLS7Z_07360 [Christensenellales bacterium]
MKNRPPSWPFLRERAERTFSRFPFSRAAGRAHVARIAPAL